MYKKIVNSGNFYLQEKMYTMKEIATKKIVNTCEVFFVVSRVKFILYLEDKNIYKKMKKQKKKCNFCNTYAI